MRKRYRRWLTKLREIPSAAGRDSERGIAARRGQLKVFLGMCPGVGKTYAMLEAAQRELKAGRDVVIGYVETHGRKETDALAAGLARRFRVAPSNIAALR